VTGYKQGLKVKFDTNWQAPPSQITITPSTIHVWRHRLEQQIPLTVPLSADENVRTKRLLDPLKQQQSYQLYL